MYMNTNNINKRTFYYFFFNNFVNIRLVQTKKLVWTEYFFRQAFH